MKAYQQMTTGMLHRSPRCSRRGYALVEVNAFIVEKVWSSRDVDAVAARLPKCGKCWVDGSLTVAPGEERVVA